MMNDAMSLLPLLALIACDSEASRGHGPFRQPLEIVAVEPSDLTSDMRGTPIRLIVYREGPEIPQLDVDNIASTVRLFKSGMLVEAKVSVAPVQFDPADTIAKRVITIEPESSLESEWYEVRFLAPAEIAEPDIRSVSSAGGMFRARSHPDHAPVLQAFDVCGLDDGTSVAILSFSENVAFNRQSAADSLRVSAGGRPCRPLWPSIANGDEDVSPDQATNSIFQFECGEFDRAGTFSISLGALVGEAGDPVVFAATDEPTVMAAMASASVFTPGCFRWRF